MSTSTLNINDKTDLICKGIAEEFRLLIMDRLSKALQAEIKAATEDMENLARQAANNVAIRVQTYNKMDTGGVVVTVAFNEKIVQEAP